jgi:GntR family transcriptional regulator, regulator for abcA and norABC
MEAMKEELDDKVNFYSPDGGIHLWCELKNKSITERELFKESLKQNVVFAPGTTLGSSQHFFRLTFSNVNDQMIKEGIQRFAQAYEVCKGEF